MFVWSFRMSKRELIIIAAGLVAFVAAASMLLCASSGAAQSSVLLDAGYSLAAGSESERAQFITQFGWQAEQEPVRVQEICLPENLTGELAEYNELQLRQGFDLSALGGERVKLWSYRVTNYPGVAEEVRIKLIVFGGVVVGGDVGATAPGGFIHGFDPAAFSAETAAAQTVTEVDRTVPDSIPAQEDAPPEPVDDDQ